MSENGLLVSENEGAPRMAAEVKEGEATSSEEIELMD